MDAEEIFVGKGEVTFLAGVDLDFGTAASATQMGGDVVATVRLPFSVGAKTRWKRADHCAFHCAGSWVRDRVFFFHFGGRI